MVYYWLTRSVNADIGEACWRRGAFVDFSEGKGVSRDSRENELWERVFNRFAWDRGREKREGELFSRNFYVSSIAIET